MVKRRWKDMLWALQADPDVIGWMDWAMGVLYLNEKFTDPAHWRMLLEGERTPHAKELLQTITHENIHFEQLSTTGYMYQWACRFYGKLLKAMKSVDAIADYIKDPDPLTLLNIEKQVCNADREDLQQHLAELDRPGPNRVRVRDLLEAHAYVVEKKFHWQNLDAVGYLQMLNESVPGPEYRHAYDLARFRIGENVAFAYFPLIASLALCAGDPPLAFDILITEMARSSFPPTPNESHYAELQRLAYETVPNLLGSSTEVYEQTHLTHPIYTAALNHINNACSQGFNLLDFFADPANQLQSIVVDVLRPIVSAANPEDQYRCYVPPHLSQADVSGQIFFSVIASRFLGPQVHHVCPSAKANGYEWLALVQPDFLQIAISAPELRSGDLGMFDRLNQANISEPWRKEASKLWGRCLVSFDLDGDEPLWARDEVRRLITNVHRSNPAFPAYLLMEPAFGMFHLWFGSLADPAAFGDQGRSLNLTHPSVVTQLMQSIAAIHAMIGGLGLESRPVLQALLTPYPREFAEELLQAIGDPKSN